MATSRGLGDTDPLTARRRRVPSTIPSSADLTAPEDPSTTAAPAASQPADRDSDPHRPTAPTADDDAPARPAKRSAKSTKSIPGNKRQVTAYINADVVDEARNAVLALMANPAGPRNLSTLVEAAITRELERLRDELHNGKPFPQRQVELQPGRPAGG
jgi:uncharacterized protein (DUF4415 family)